MMDLLWRPCSLQRVRNQNWSDVMPGKTNWWRLVEYLKNAILVIVCQRKKNKTYHGALIPWMLRNIIFFEWSLPTDILSHRSSHTWGFLKMVDPQVTMGFETSIYSDILIYDLALPLALGWNLNHHCFPKMVLKSFRSGWFLVGKTMVYPGYPEHTPCKTTDVLLPS